MNPFNDRKTMKKNSFIYSMASALMTAAVAACGLTACSSDDNIAEETPIVNPTQTNVHHVSIPATMGDGSGTRAVSFDGTTSNSTFSTSELVYVYNATTSTLLDGTLSPTNVSADGKSCDLTGTLTGTLTAGDNLKLLYNLNRVDGQKSYFYYRIQDGITPLDGATATATVGTYTGGVLTTTATASFQNAQSMFRFKFQDENGAAINVKSLRIDSHNYSLTAFYYPLYAADQYSPYYNITLATATTDYIYAALCFDESESVGEVLTFTATDADDNEYEGTKSAPSGGFKNGKYYYNSSAIQLTKQGSLVKPTITWTSPSSPVEPDEDNIYTVRGTWNGSAGAHAPIDITLSGTSKGYEFYLGNAGTVTLNGITASHKGANWPFIQSYYDINLVVNGENSINCKNSEDGIFIIANLKLSGNGSLTITCNDAEYRGICATNYNNYSASALEADGYTVSLSDEINNGDGTYTWTYTVRPRN